MSNEETTCRVCGKEIIKCDDVGHFYEDVYDDDTSRPGPLERPDPLAQLEAMLRKGNIIIGANEGGYYAMHLSGGNAEGTTLAAAIDALARKVGQ